MRRLLVAVVALVALWLGVLVVLDFVLEDRETTGISARLGESLKAKATIDATDLALVRGRLSLNGLALRRDDDVGHLAIDVGEIRCDLPPLGYALVDGNCRELAVSRTRLEVSSAALFHVENPKRPPIRADRVVIDDAVLTFAPSAFVPSLGRIEVEIDHAVAGPTVFRTPLSWLFALDELHARLKLPAGIVVTLDVHGHVLSASGSLLGGSPVEVPFDLPVAHDAHEEIALLAKTGTDLAEKLVEKRALDWVQKKIR